MNEKLYITIGDTTLSATLTDNSSTQALIAALRMAPITYEAHDYGNFEKVGDLGQSFPTNDEKITTEPGDLILYQGHNLCIYYDVNTWNFTRLGKIDSITQDELKFILGEENKSITLSLSVENDTVNNNGKGENQNNVKEDDEAPTEIRQTKSTSNRDMRMYDMQGRRITSPAKGQFYIQGGEKRIRIE